MLLIPFGALALRVDNPLDPVYFEPLIVYSFVSLPFWIGVFVACGMYSRYWQYASLEEMGVILKAVILGTVLEPLVEALERRGVKPVLATIAALVVALALAAGTVAIVVSGFIQQLPEISKQLLDGWQSMVNWARSLEIDSVWLEQARIAFQNYAPKIGQGALGAVSSTFSGAVSFAVGSFFAVFFLFFVLRDARGFPAWLARVTRLDPGLSEEVIGVAKQSLRGYFKGTAITALITAPIFLVPLLVLGLP